MSRVHALAASILALAVGASRAAAGPDLDAAAKKSMRVASNPVVRLHTSMGAITLELYREEAPKTTANFLAYARAKHYDGTIFHRVMPRFMIQGGGLDRDLREKKTQPPIANEAGNGVSNARGTIAMARTDDPDSATDQFFVNLKDNKFLDKSASGDGYAVFGKVLQGLDVVDRIAAVPTAARGGHEAVPVAPVVIQSVAVLQP